MFGESGDGGSTKKGWLSGLVSSVNTMFTGSNDNRSTSTPSSQNPNSTQSRPYAHGNAAHVNHSQQQQPHMYGSQHSSFNQPRLNPSNSVPWSPQSNSPSHNISPLAPQPNVGAGTSPTPLVNGTWNSQPSTPLNHPPASSVSSFPNPAPTCARPSFDRPQSQPASFPSHTPNTLPPSSSSNSLRSTTSPPPMLQAHVPQNQNATSFGIVSSRYALDPSSSSQTTPQGNMQQLPTPASPTSPSSLNTMPSQPHVPLVPISASSTSSSSSAQPLIQPSLPTPSLQTSNLVSNKYPPIPGPINNVVNNSAYQATPSSNNLIASSSSSSSSLPVAPRANSSPNYSMPSHPSSAHISSNHHNNPSSSQWSSSTSGSSAPLPPPAPPGSNYWAEQAKQAQARGEVDSGEQLKVDYSDLDYSSMDFQYSRTIFRHTDGVYNADKAGSATPNGTTL